MGDKNGDSKRGGHSYPTEKNPSRVVVLYPDLSFLRSVLYQFLPRRLACTRGIGQRALSRECRSIPASEKTPKVLAAGIEQPSSMLVRFQDNRATFRLAIVPHCDAIFLRLLCLSNLESIT